MEPPQQVFVERSADRDVRISCLGGGGGHTYSSFPQTQIQLMKLKIFGGVCTDPITNKV